MLTDSDKQFLKIAYDEAKSGFDSGGCPIGSVLARRGQEVSRGHNQRVQRLTSNALRWNKQCLWSHLQHERHERHNN